MNPSDSRILTDENISPRVVIFLREAGFDVSDIKEMHKFGITDKVVLEIAHSENRIVITHDSDFGMLAINQGVPFIAIIYIRLKIPSAESVINALRKFLETDIKISNGMLAVIEEDRIRLRTV